MSETTQYRYWLERLKRMKESTTPAVDTKNRPESAGYSTDKTDKTGAEASEIAWRVAAIRSQVPATGPIPFLVARQTTDTSVGRCWSCGDALDVGRSVRCVPCVLAVEAVLNEVREGA
jgi:hypothetical protein